MKVLNNNEQNIYKSKKVFLFERNNIKNGKDINYKETFYFYKTLEITHNLQILFILYL
jgi:hypothetical protein